AKGRRSPPPLLGRVTKILLVGPFPPPHGGISVHVRTAHAILTDAGVQCAVLNTEKLRPWRFVRELIARAFEDWTLHVHTNGHNPKSWVVALAGGIAAQFGAGGVLTLHSGFVPDFVARGPMWRRQLARLTCLLYTRVVCVNPDIAGAIEGLGIPQRSLEILPAYLHTPASVRSAP